MMSNTTTEIFSSKIDTINTEQDKGISTAIMMSQTPETKKIMIKPKRASKKPIAQPPLRIRTEEEQKDIDEAREVLELAKQAEAESLAKLRAIEAEQDEDEICKGCINNNGEDIYDGYCEECHAEQLGHHQQAPDAQEDDAISNLTDEYDEEKALLAKLAEVKLKKAKAQARENITELRAELKEYQQKLIAETEQHLAKLKAQFDTIDEGAYDDELIDKKVIIPKQTAKPKGERKQPTYEGKGKKAGTGDCRAKLIAMLNNGKNLNKLSYAKLYKGMTWYLYDETRPNKGVQVYKDEDGKYDIPILMDCDWIGFRRTKQGYIDWLKEN